MASAPEPVQVSARDLELESAVAARVSRAGPLAIGFSGGVDSAYLAVVALEVLGPDRCLAVLGRSASVAAEQWERAREVALAHGLPLAVVDTSELDDPRYAANPVNRCYFCKSTLWTTLVPVARARGFASIADGTNADDLGDYRPGARAAQEWGIISPLAEVGLGKDAIRRLSRARGLSTWDQPSSPCLASRLPYGTAVTSDRLLQVDRAERALRELGVGGNLRVRHHGDLARVELDPAELERWSTHAALRRVRDAVRGAGFARVSLDLRGFRSGSLNVLAGVVSS